MLIKKNNKIIAREAIILKSFLSQVVGLRFKKQKNLVFDFKKEKKEIIDMIFVFYPIDLVFLDKSKKVIEIKKNIKPFTFYKTKNEVKFLLELNRGSIEKSNIKLGDKLSF
jgi:uncharacterized membrane protein (UPF0127 family)